MRLFYAHEQGVDRKPVIAHDDSVSLHEFRADEANSCAEQIGVDVVVFLSLRDPYSYLGTRRSGGAINAWPRSLLVRLEVKLAIKVRFAWQREGVAAQTAGIVWRIRVSRHSHLVIAF